jgi:WD40 repeat protein
MKRYAPALLALTLLASLLWSFAGQADAAMGNERGYELVSPGNDPNNQKVEVLPIAHASASGEAIAFQMFGTVEYGPSEERNSYVSKRGPEGWVSTLVSPPAAPFQNAFYKFSPNQVFQFNEDFSEALLSSKNTSPLVPGEVDEGYTNLYLHNTETGAYSLITNSDPHPRGDEVSANYPFARPRVAWASKDLQHVLFDSYNGRAPEYNPGWPTSTDTEPRGAVIAWSPQTGMQVASILPNGEEVTAEAGAGSLGVVGGKLTSAYSDRFGGSEHAMSEDGSRIYFTHIRHLYLRRDNGTPQASTIRIDEPEAGLPSEYWANLLQYVTASPDGHRALFLCGDVLTTNSDAHGTPNHRSPELYLYNEGTGLTDISAGDPTGGGVLGVVGVSEDLNRVYFVAEGALTGAAVKGKPNLYLWDSTTGLTFIAQLGGKYQSEEDPDTNIWELPMGLNGLRVTPDGSTIAFSTQAQIDTGFDNESPESYNAFQELYVWQIGDTSPECVTCIGTATGPSTLVNQGLTSAEAKLAVLETWSKLNLLPDGSAVYFDSSQKLLPADHNLVADVYEYNLAEEKLALISTGRAATASNFMGASSDGRDVFFRTTQSLIPSDINGAYDIYDARRGGGNFPEKEPPALACEGELCPKTPASVEAHGVGNQAPAKPFALAPITAGQKSAFARTGRITVQTETPSAGQVTIRVIARPPDGKWRRVATAQATAAGEGTQSVELKLKKGVQQLLAAKGRLQVRIVASFGAQQASRQLALKHGAKR